MMLTRASDYALRSMLYLAEQPGKKVTILNEIAERQGVPKNFLAKILQVLARNGLVKSHQGVHGGYFIDAPLHSITLKSIIEAMEGPIVLNRCLIQEGECERENSCPMHKVWVEAQEKLMSTLGKATLADMLETAQL